MGKAFRFTPLFSLRRLKSGSLRGLGSQPHRRIGHAESRFKMIAEEKQGWQRNPSDLELTHISALLLYVSVGIIMAKR